MSAINSACKKEDAYRKLLARYVSKGGNETSGKECLDGILMEVMTKEQMEKIVERKLVRNPIQDRVGLIIDTRDQAIQALALSLVYLDFAPKGSATKLASQFVCF